MSKVPFLLGGVIKVYEQGPGSWGCTWGGFGSKVPVFLGGLLQFECCVRSMGSLSFKTRQAHRPMIRARSRFLWFVYVVYEQGPGFLGVFMKIYQQVPGSRGARGG